MKEAQLQKLIVDYCRWHPSLECVRLNAGNIKTSTGSYMRTGRAGVADLLVLGAGGRFMQVELKTAKGRLSASQKRWQKRMNELEQPYAVVRSLDEFTAALTREGWENS